MAEPGEGAAGPVKARRLGRLTAEERAARLCDPGTFAREGAALEGASGVAGDGVVLGVGLVDGRPVTVIATDGRVLRGTIGARGGEAIVRALEGARRAGRPVVLLLDSDGARQSEGLAAVRANTRVLATLAELGGYVPRLGAVFGAAGGSAAYALALTDVAVGVADRSFAFVAGPAVVAAALGEESSLEALGGRVQLGNGLLHAALEDDAAVLAWLRAALAYLPASAATLAPDRDEAREHDRPTARAGLAGIVPADAKAPWSHAAALAGLLDGPWLELGAAWGASVRVGFGRLAGRALGVVISSPADRAGAIDAAAARKVARFVRLAAAFNLPLLTVCDTPGFLPGARSEAEAVLCHGAALISAYVEARRAVPRVALVVRRAIGAGAVLVADADVVLALPGAIIQQLGDASGDAAAAASGVARQGVSGSAEGAGLVHRTIDAAHARVELVRAFERLPRATPVGRGERRMALGPT